MNLDQLLQIERLAAGHRERPLFDVRPGPGDAQPEELREAAGWLELDVARFDEDLTLRRHAQRVRDDFMSGVRSGVNGTPTFFINGRRHDGDFDLATLLEAIRSALVSV